MTIVAMVPARKGSKGLPGKNTRDLAGKPMIAYTIEAAKEAGLAVVVNTDCNACSGVAWRTGADQYARPANLARDDSTMLDVLKDFAANGVTSECTAIAVLYPTYPLRTAEDIRNSVEAYCIGSVHPSPIIGVRKPRAHPYMCVTLDKGKPKQLIPHDRNTHYKRQQLPDVWQLTHSTCIVPVHSIRTLDAQLMNDQTRAHAVQGPVIDIDTEDDFRHAEALLRTRMRDSLSESMARMLAVERDWGCG